MTMRRAAFLLAGWHVVGVALSPPFDAVADENLPWHMLQHMLLLAVAPPLLVLGEPIRVAFDLLPPRRAQQLAGAARRAPPAPPATGAPAHPRRRPRPLRPRRRRHPHPRRLRHRPGKRPAARARAPQLP